MSEEKNETSTDELAEITEAWINALLDESVRRGISSGDVGNLLKFTGAVLQGIAGRYRPRGPSQPFAWGKSGKPATTPVFVAHTPELAIGDVVRADIYRDNEIHEGKVVDVVIGKYLAQSVTEIDYLLDLGNGQELWVGPGQIEGVKRGEEWAEYHMDGAR